MGKENHVLNVKIRQVFKSLVLDRDIVNPMLLCLVNAAITGTFVDRVSGIRSDAVTSTVQDFLLAFRRR